MTFYIKHQENLLCFIFDSFLTCNVLKITSSVPMEDFSLNFKVFVLIITCLIFCLRNKRFVVMVQKFCLKGSYWIKPCETLAKFLYFILFAICVTFLLVKTLLFSVLKSVNFILSLFGPIFKYRITITLARSKTWIPRKSRKFFSDIFKSEFSILALGQNRKLGITFPRFPRFLRFSNFRFLTFSFSFLFFPLFCKCFFKFFNLHYSSTHYFIKAVRLSH